MSLSCLKKNSALAGLLGLCFVAGYAQLSLTTTSYSQDFDTLASSGTNPAWANNSTLAGWYLFNSAGNAPATYAVGTGSSNAGAFYSFGASGSSERALGGTASGGAYFGSPAAGTTAGWIALGLTNGTGSLLDTLTITYTGEQWRDGGSATPTAQTMILEYGFGATFAGVSQWTAAGSGFNFTSPVLANTLNGAAVNGNVAGAVAGLGGVLSVAWTSESTLWLRWKEDNNFGNDHGLALDNFSLTASAAAAIPEPSTYAALAGAAALGLAVYRRRRLVA